MKYREITIDGQGPERVYACSPNDALDADLSFRYWYANAASGLQRCIKSAEDLDAAREGVGYALGGPQPHDWTTSTTCSPISGSRRQRLARRAYDVTTTGVAFGDLEPIRVMLDDNMISNPTVREVSD